MSEQNYEKLEAEAKGHGILYKGIWISVIAGVAVFFVLAIFGDIKNVGQSLADFNWIYFPIGLALALANYFIRFGKWDFYLRSIGIRIKPVDSLLIFLSGLIMCVTPGKIGEVSKAYLLKKLDGTEMRRSIPVIIAERVTDVFGLLLLTAISFSSFKYGLPVLIVILVLAFALVAVIKSRTLSLWVINRTRKMRFLSKVSDTLETAYENTHTLFKWKNFILGTLLSAVSWSCECLVTYLALIGFNVHVSVLLPIFVFSFSLLIGAVSFIPGGLLVVEGSSAGILVLAGIAKSVAVGSTIISRVCTLWFGPVVGTVAFLLFRGRLKRQGKSL